MLRPLQEFICDTCQQVINSPSEGVIEWIEYTNPSTGRYEIHSFRIVHHMSASPRQHHRSACYQHDHARGQSDMGLEYFTSPSPHQMPNILHFLDPGPHHMSAYSGPFILDMREYVDTVRRLTIPYFEEARQFWSRAEADGLFIDENEISIYGETKLQEVISQYT